MDSLFTYEKYESLDGFLEEQGITDPVNGSEVVYMDQDELQFKELLMLFGRPPEGLRYAKAGDMHIAYRQG